MSNQVKKFTFGMQKGDQMDFQSFGVSNDGWVACREENPWAIV